MKKTILSLLLILALLVSLAGCAGKPNPVAESIGQEIVSGIREQAKTEPNTEAPTEATEPPTEAPTEPEGQPGAVLYDGTQVLCALLNREDTVQILGEEEEYYRIATENGEGLVEKRLIRAEGQEAYAPHDGYASASAPFYDNYHLVGEATILNLNTKLQVLEDLGGCMLVRCGEILGYMAPDRIMAYPYTYQGGGNNNGGGADGGDISLSAPREDYRVSLLSTVTSGTVLADGAEVIADTLDAGTKVLVTEAGEETATLWLDGRFVTVPRALIALEGDPAYESWNGYAVYQAKAYSSCWLTAPETKALTINTPIEVIGDLGWCYAVRLEGAVFFMEKTAVSTYPIQTGGNNNSGGGDWTPPAM